MLWTESEIEILRAYYPTEGRAVMERLPERSADSIFNKAAALGLHCSISMLKGPEWSDAELAVLLVNYYKLGAVGCSKLLPGRSEFACRNKAIKYGLMYSAYVENQGAHLSGPYNKHWKPAELKLLKRYYPTMGADARFYIPGRSKSAVRTQARKQGIKYIGGIKK